MDFVPTMGGGSDPVSPFDNEKDYDLNNPKCRAQKLVCVDGEFLIFFGVLGVITSGGVRPGTS